MVKINKKLTMKVISLVVTYLISLVFIKAISDSVRNSIPIIKVWWFFIVPILALIDFIVWIKTGEELVTWILELNSTKRSNLIFLLHKLSIRKLFIIRAKRLSDGLELCQ